MSTKDYILNMLNSALTPVLVTLFAALAAPLISWLKTGSFVEIFKEIPLHIWIFFLLVVIVWFFGTLISKRYAKIKLYNSSSIVIGDVGFSGYDLKTIDEFPYKKVIWEIQHPIASSWMSYSPNFSPENIKITIPPRCPTCRTELEETKSFWGGYKWRCVNCGFKQKNKEDWYTEAQRVKKLAKRGLEIKMERKKYGR